MKFFLKPLCMGLVILLLLIYGLQNSFVTFRQVFRELRYIVSHPTDTYDDKMRIYWWTVYDFLQFVRNSTPEDAKIVIPPQERPWLTSGNGGIVNYFLYPRTILVGGLDYLPDTSFEYVAIVHGEWADAPAKKYGWPKVYIPADKILYFDQQTKTTKVIDGDYDPMNPINKEVNGLIKIKTK